MKLIKTKTKNNKKEVDELLYEFEISTHGNESLELTEKEINSKIAKLKRKEIQYNIFKEEYTQSVIIVQDEIKGLEELLALINK